MASLNGFMNMLGCTNATFHYIEDKKEQHNIAEDYC